MRLLLGILCALCVLACGDDGSGSSEGGTPLAEASEAEYQRLCQRAMSDELGVWVECTESSSCESCVDELLGTMDVDTCQSLIGSPALYAQTHCTWTVQQLDACFDERNALTTASSCTNPPARESSCLHAFGDDCMDLGGSGEEPDMRPPPSASGCDDTCETPNDGECDDGGPDSITDGCGLGTDCTDCGPR